MVFKGKSGKLYFTDNSPIKETEKSTNFKSSYKEYEHDGIVFFKDKDDDFFENGLKIYIVFQNDFYGYNRFSNAISFEQTGFKENLEDVFFPKAI